MSEAESAGKSIAIILGASSFPKTDLESNQAFLKSAVAFDEYLRSAKGLGLSDQSILNLFDTDKSLSELRDSIVEFFKMHREKGFDNLIIYYVGHGDFSDKHNYYLAIKDTQTDDSYFTSLPIENLAGLLKEHARHARRFLILDSCFSGAAYAGFQSAPLQAAVQKTRAEFAASDVPGRGTALLCATGPRDTASAPPEEEFTMFSGAMIEVLKHGVSAVPEVLSLKELCERTWSVIKDRYGGEGIRPVQSSPEQKHGDVGSIPLFPIPGRSQRRQEAGGVPGPFFDALDEETFATTGETIHCVIVTAESRAAKYPLEHQVRRAWDNYAGMIFKRVDEYRALHRGNKLTAQGHSPPAQTERLATLPASSAFRTDESLRRAVAAICRADVAIFDVTGFEPGPMFLLGVRSVARRGVTICSLGGQYIIGADISIPFNLQSLNLSAHSDHQIRPEPHHLLGEKMKAGFRELKDLPHYLDLPAFDSVRLIGLSANAYRPIEYTSQILFLCPFGEIYSENNWNIYHSQELSGRLKARLRRQLGAEIAEPRLIRLLDIETPRLVAQTLYEAIRLTEMCVIDWTNVRANVIYEMGVRLASNPLGGIHVVEECVVEESAGRDVIPDDAPEHTYDMMKLFDLIRYRCKPGDVEAYDQIIDAFEARKDPKFRNTDYLVYQTVGASRDLSVEPIALPVEEELIRGANTLASDDKDSIGISPVLYNDVNKMVEEGAVAAAMERRLAAWLYMDGRYTNGEIQGSPTLLTQYRTLGAQVRRWLSRSGRTLDRDLADRIGVRTREVAATKR